MRNVKKVVIALFVILIVASIVCSNNVFAYDMMATINAQADATADDSVTKSVSNISGAVITIARVVCAAVAVAMLAILGMKYMSAAPSEKADIKKHAVVYIVGACLMFAVLQTASNAGYTDEMKTLIDKDYSDSTGTDAKVNEITATVITSIRIVGICVAIVMLLTVAMKYMTAAPGDKADIKKSSIQYVVGAIVLFGAVGLLSIISKFSSGIKAG